MSIAVYDPSASESRGGRVEERPQRPRDARRDREVHEPAFALVQLQERRYLRVVRVQPRKHRRLGVIGAQ